MKKDRKNSRGTGWHLKKGSDNSGKKEHPFEKFRDKQGGEKKRFRKPGRPFFKPERDEPGKEKVDKRDSGNTSRGENLPFEKGKRPFQKFRGKRTDEKKTRGESDRPFQKFRKKKPRPESRFFREDKPSGSRNDTPGRKWEKPSVFFKRKREESEKKSSNINPLNAGLIRLNKYIANAGICSRREADTLIAGGLISVNGKIITQLGTKIKEEDVVKYAGETLRRERNVYVLLNKPKDYITTVKDTHERKTVLELVKGACKERIYPVGRLDRNTTGVLLLTNDGALTKKLTHPKYGAKKIYHVETDKNVSSQDLKLMTEGIKLDDEDLVKADNASYSAEHLAKNQITVVMHSGKNRVVRRMLESLGYSVTKLDRVFFAGLTKKDLQRGRWRFLSEKEVGFLKMIGSGPSN